MNLAKDYLAKSKKYFIKPNYVHRSQPEYFVHELCTQVGFVYQPLDYPFAFCLARSFECNTVIDIGPGNAEKLIRAHPEFQIIGLDYGARTTRLANGSSGISIATRLLAYRKM